jgi:DNA-binding transcriptional LysR family regulator
MIDALITFLAVAEAGGFAKIARAQGVAVSSITRRIDWLEGELKTRLFIRSSRRVMLTDSGALFLSRARNIVDELADAKESLSALSADLRGVLTVTAPAAFGRRHVAPAVIGFLKQYPQIEMDLHISDDVLDLGLRRVDVAIRMGPLHDGKLVATPLAPLRRLTCASPEYLARKGRPASPIDLLQHNCLTVSSTPSPPGWWCFAGVHRDMPLPVRGTLRTDDTEALLQAAVSGVGIVHLASWLVSDMIATGRLISLFPDARATGKAMPAINAVRMPGRSHSAKAKLFIAHLRKSFGSPPYWERTSEAS